MERNAVSLETAKRLKASGFPQYKAEFYWCKDKKLGWVIARAPEKYDESYAAPTAQEIADELPNLELQNGDGKWSAWTYRGELVEVAGEPSMADALAQLWLKLNKESTHGR